MDAGGSSKRSRPVRRATKLKFKPKVPPQKPKKLTTEKPQQEEPKPVDEELMKILRTGQVAAKTLLNTKDERSAQNPPSTPPSAAVVSLSPPQSGLHKQNQSKALQIPIAFPVVNPGMFYNEEEDDDDNDDDDDDDDSGNVEFQETQPNSIECEVSTRPAEELDLLEQDGKERMFLFQLPKSLPLPRKSSVVEKKGKVTSKEVKEGSNLQQLPQGYLGKMLVYKSGKIKMKLGDVMFDVNPGVESRMAQHAVALNTREKHCCLLGEIGNRHVIVTPDVNSLLNDN
ncbi:uncharacterized protein LOC133926251 isoform X3 [Phragmites australis]|uniref:uncharacterized protein LOC133926251 isoform X3 n=1 Tax=Phragmites australis TaxID=29695 RepID=UPI002D771FF4|nr:uncharacterized protein LOC133926251 isoform X3 [Phragmites australis]